MKRYSLAAAPLTGCALLMGFMASAASVKDMETQDNEQITKLLKDVRTLAFQIKEDAVEMATYTHMNLDWSTHAQTINQIRDHMNQLGRAEDKLMAAKKSASPWQKAAIDRIEPYVNEMSGYTAAVIEHINGTPKHTPAEYQDYLEANADYSSDLAAMIADFVDYGRAKDRMDRLATKLEIRPGK